MKPLVEVKEVDGRFWVVVKELQPDRRLHSYEMSLDQFRNFATRSSSEAVRK